MAPGLVLSIQFTAFDVDITNTNTARCRDYLKMIDGDGTTLMDKTCGSYLPGAITSTSNTVRFYFTSTSWFSKSGWSLNWTAVTAGGGSPETFHVAVLKNHPGSLDIFTSRINQVSQPNLLWLSVYCV